MTIHSENINMLWGSLLVEELLRNRITYFCISPGSRSSPLTIAVARNGQAVTRICYDERGAAFHALGYARATGRPAVLICTSGTALANYLPAVVEASVDVVPLLILSADRPPELLDSGANQAILQPGIFGKYVRWRFDLPCPDEKIPPETVLTTVDQAVYRALRSPAGPVHLNCHFREPLAPTTQEIPANYLQSISAWEQGKQPFTAYSRPILQQPPSAMEDIRRLVGRAKHGILVSGNLHSEADRKASRKLAIALGWPLFADILSGLRLGNDTANHVACFDQLLLSDELQQSLRPDVILHLGGRLTSKLFLQFMEKYSPQEYIMVAEHPYRHDPAHRLTNRLEMSVADFCSRLMEGLSPQIDEDWTARIAKKSQLVSEIIEEQLAKRADLTEPEIARLISQNIPAGHALFLASSLPIREMDMFADAGRAAVPIAANRGASGIDGTIASASGFAQGFNRAVTLLIGDLAFLHDLNSLSLLKSNSQPLIIVLLNNGGGGIFSFLPVAEFKEIFDPWFSTPHDYTFENAARLFQLDYFSPHSREEFLQSYSQAVQNGKSALIEIQTDRESNFKLQKDLRQKVLEILKSQ